MTVEEIKECVEQFRQGALNSMEAGFDGVEVRILTTVDGMPNSNASECLRCVGR